jgi:hypothetical protein
MVTKTAKGSKAPAVSKYRALVTIYDNDNNVLAEEGETCERVPPDVIKEFIELGYVEEVK